MTKTPAQLLIPGIARRYGSIKLMAVPGLEGIAASDRGDLWSARSGKWYKLKPYISGGRGAHTYYRVKIRDRSRPNQGLNIRVHRAVALAWHGEPSHWADEVDHINRNRYDNRPENLRWISKDRNLARRNGNGASSDVDQISDEDWRYIL